MWEKYCRAGQDTFLIISRSVLLRMRNVSDKSCTENQNTHFVFSNFFSKIVPFMRWCGKNIVERGRTQMAIWRMRIACWIPKATNTHSEYVTLIAFPLLQWLHVGVSKLRHTYIDCIVPFNYISFHQTKVWCLLHIAVCCGLLYSETTELC